MLNVGKKDAKFNKQKTTFVERKGVKQTCKADWKKIFEHRKGGEELFHAGEDLDLNINMCV